MKLCACGCGLQVTKESNSFLHGHNRRDNPSRATIRYELTCLHCHKPFYVRRGLRNIRKYCSHSCYRTYKNNGVFGHIPWSKGLTKKDDERLESIGRAQIGRSPWNKGLKGIHQSPQSEFKKGMVLSEETKRKISLASARRVYPMENTRIEAMLKDEFARQGIRFEMQKPVGFCRPDFYLPDFNAFVFADGCYWHGCPLHRPNMKKRRTNDAQNNAFLINRGFRVYRFWEHEILQSPFKCVNLILRDKVNLAPLQPIEVFDKLQAEKLKVPEMYGFCECGCGKRVAKPENHFLLGHSKKRNGFHHRKHQFSSSALEKIANLQRGKSLGEEMKRKIAQGIQNYWQTKRDVSLLFVDFRTEDNFQNGSKIMVDL